MNILAIDTTSAVLTAMAIKNEKIFSREINVGKSGHSAILIPTVDEVLKECELKPSELDVVAVVVGPGSFTGIRIGVAAMTAIAFACGAKRIAVNTFELIAYNRARITAAIDAGHGNTYLAQCENGKILRTFFAESCENIVPSDAVWSTVTNVSEVLTKVVLNKINAGEYVPVFEPVYMRKSQAERNADEI